MTGTMKTGSYHLRPCVRAIWPGDPGKNRPSWIPVLGPQHSDLEIIRFKHQHFHIDHRFLRKEQQGGEFRKGVNLVFATTITTVTPQVDSGTTNVSLEDLPDPRYPTESWWRVMRRRFREPYPGYPTNGVVPWIQELHEAYREERLKPGLICPHRGAPLEGLEADPEGCVTCPLHGLRWHLESGELRSETITETESSTGRSLHGETLSKPTTLWR